jgi:hypothetical protein
MHPSRPKGPAFSLKYLSLKNSLPAAYGAGNSAVRVQAELTTTCGCDAWSLVGPGALILDPGKDSHRLQIDELAPEWRIGDERVE